MIENYGSTYTPDYTFRAYRPSPSPVSSADDPFLGETTDLTLLWVCEASSSL
jgi:hypothetical protein